MTPTSSASNSFPAWAPDASSVDESILRKGLRAGEDESAHGGLQCSVLLNGEGCKQLVDLLHGIDVVVAELTQCLEGGQAGAAAFGSSRSKATKAGAADTSVM
jgi:hypothetical protein